MTPQEFSTRFRRMPSKSRRTPATRRKPTKPRPHAPRLGLVRTAAHQNADGDEDSESPDVAIVAERIQTLRDERGMSIERFAEWLGLESHSTVSDWLNEKRLPSAKHLFSIGRKCGVTTDWLLGRANVRQYPDQSCTKIELAKELAAYVARDLRTRGLIDADAPSDIVDGELLLEKARRVVAGERLARGNGSRADEDAEARQLMAAATVISGAAGILRATPPAEELQRANRVLNEVPAEVALGYLGAQLSYVGDPGARRRRNDAIKRAYKREPNARRLPLPPDRSALDER